MASAQGQQGRRPASWPTLSKVLPRYTDDEIAQALVALGRDRIGGVVLGLKQHLTAELQNFVLSTWMTGQVAGAAAERVGADLGARIGRGLAGMLHEMGQPPKKP